MTGKPITLSEARALAFEASRKAEQERIAASDRQARLDSDTVLNLDTVDYDRQALKAILTTNRRLIEALKAIAERRYEASCDSGLAWDMGLDAVEALKTEGIKQNPDTCKWEYTPEKEG